MKTLLLLSMSDARGVVGIVVLLAGHFAFGETIQGKVVSVADEDTITVLDANQQQHKVRFAGIDAPEKKQPFGQKSKAQLSDSVFSKEFTLECGKRDKYRREVCVVILDGQDINLEQIKVGLAWWYRKYAKEQTPQQRLDYEQAESDAKAAKRGLWSEPDPAPPWEWRHRKGSRQ